MKPFLAVCLVAVLALCSCEDTPYPIEEPIVRLQADVSQKVLTPIGASTDTTRVDSLLVTSVKILVRRVQLRREQSAEQYEPLVSAPLVLTVPAGDAYAAVFPLGNYDGAAVELSRLTDSEAASYASDGRYANFVTAERPSFVMEGSALKQGVWRPFRLTADTAVAAALMFDSPIGIPKGSSTDIVLLLDLPQLMLFGTEIIDPLAVGNDQVLEGNIGEALRIMKKDR